MSVPYAKRLKDLEAARERQVLLRGQPHDSMIKGKACQG
ncbi:Hypothetical Protein XCAW_04011 [Xanthomonas citri subsp. citri Aw12879]|nr:Hypothetical Protein XCAW_04011 [Xanthomonas citri subsp. citri Aw12879]